MSRTFIFLIILLQGLFAINGINVCFHENCSTKIELVDNCCENEPIDKKEDIDCIDDRVSVAECKDCYGISIFGEWVSFSFKNKNKVIPSKEVILNYSCMGVLFKEIKSRVFFSPQAQRGILLYQVKQLKKIILLI